MWRSSRITSLEQETQIVFVAVVDNRYTVLINKFREGSTLYYSPEYIRNFVQITPVIIVDALEKLKLMLGSISTVVIRYEKRVLLFSRYEDMIIVLGFDPSIPTPFPDSMARLIRKVASESE